MVDAVTWRRANQLLHVGVVVAVLVGHVLVGLRFDLFASKVTTVLWASWASLVAVNGLKFLYWRGVLDSGSI